MIKRLGIAESKSRCLPSHDDRWSHFPNGGDKTAFRVFIAAVEPFLDKEIQVRAEGNRFSIYCKDPVLLDQMIEQLSQWLVEVHRPINEAELDFMTNNSAKKVICNHLPYHQYHYKLFIKQSISFDTKLKFSSWVLNYPSSIKVPTTTQNWFHDQTRWAWSPFIYIDNSSTLSMVGLFLGNNTQRVEEFIPRDSINIS
jgi:hypothetical protein